MTVDSKIARHICSVIRRQVQDTFPDLRLFFVVHKENERAHTYIREKHSISDHPCYNHLQIYLETAESSHKLLNQNDTEFSLIARQNNPGFAGLFKKNDYLALCFVNSDRFESEETLKNHIFHIAWHAISLYKNFVIKTDARSRNEKEPCFSDIDNILQSTLSQKDKYEQNLIADIFSCAMQTKNGTKKALESIFMQRAQEALNKSIGFCAENYPFPACLEQIEFALEQSSKELSLQKAPVLKAMAFAENFIKSYDSSVINQWYDFAYPAQRMAWANHPPEVILGAALFTGEKTHIQSIADMISERAHITSQNIIDLQDYNPFTAEEANQRQHKKLCASITTAAVEQAFTFQDHKKLISKAIQQNEELTNARTMGWCAFALYTASKVFKHADAQTTPDELRTQIKSEIEKAVSDLPWEVLSEFSTTIFDEIRYFGEISMEKVKEFASKDDKFINIYSALNEENVTVKNKNSSVTPTTDKASQASSGGHKNIGDFISPNAVIK